MAYEVEFTEDFRAWYEDILSVSEQRSVARVVEMLEQAGPMLPFPFSSGIANSKLSHMRELRLQHEGRPYRVLYAFDPRRTALLLVGGEKTAMTGGTTRWSQKPRHFTGVICGKSKRNKSGVRP